MFRGHCRKDDTGIYLAASVSGSLDCQSSTPGFGSTSNLTGHTLSCLCIWILVEVWNGAVGLMERRSLKGPRTSAATVW